MIKCVALGGVAAAAVCTAVLLHDVNLQKSEPFDPMTATVVLKTPNGGKCTGTHIGNGTILTAGHCTDKEGDKLTATFKNGKEFESVTLWKSEAYDVAMLRMSDSTSIEISPDGMPYVVETDATDNPYAELNCKPLSMDDTVEMYGHPMAMTWIKTNGVVAGDVTGAYKTAWLEVLPIDGAMGPGMSGGGVFNDDGSVVGINVGVPIAGNGFGGGYPVGISFIVPSSTICGLIGR